MGFQGLSAQVNHSSIMHLYLVCGLMKTRRHQGQFKVPQNECSKISLAQHGRTDSGSQKERPESMAALKGGVTSPEMRTSSIGVGSQQLKASNKVHKY